MPTDAKLMSLAKVVTSDTVITSDPAVLFGVALASSTPNPPSTGAIIIKVYDDSTTTSPSNQVAELHARYGEPQQSGGTDQIVFPAGIRCGNGITVKVTSGGHTLAVTVDYS